ncbi:MAG: hypothetical protein V4727_03725 [Verrucomicrobiota bacterium]
MSEDIVTVAQVNVEPLPENPHFYTHEAGMALAFSRGTGADTEALFLGYLGLHKWKTLSPCQVFRIPAATLMPMLPRQLLEEVALVPFHVVLGAHQLGESPEFLKLLSEIGEDKTN